MDDREVRQRPRERQRRRPFHLDPHGAARPEARQEYFDRWCKGVYRGRVQYENADGEVEYVKVRFRFRVR